MGPWAVDLVALLETLSIITASFVSSPFSYFPSQGQLLLVANRINSFSRPCPLEYSHMF